MENKINEILNIKDDIDYKKISVEDILLLKEYIEINNLIEKQNKINKVIKLLQDMEDFK